MVMMGVWARTSASFRRRLSHGTEPHILFPAIAVLGLLAIWGTTLNLIRVERAAAEHTAAVSSDELAETYEAQVVRALREIDQTLKFVKYAYELRGRQAVLQELKDKSLLPPDLLFVVSIADSTGDVVASTNPSAMANVANEDYFQSARRIDTLSVGRPPQARVRRVEAAFQPPARRGRRNVRRHRDGLGGRRLFRQRLRDVQTGRAWRARHPRHRRRVSGPAQRRSGVCRRHGSTTPRWCRPRIRRKPDATLRPPTPGTACGATPARASSTSSRWP